MPSDHSVVLVFGSREQILSLALRCGQSAHPDKIEAIGFACVPVGKLLEISQSCFESQASGESKEKPSNQAVLLPRPHPHTAPNFLLRPELGDTHTHFSVLYATDIELTVCPPQGVPADSKAFIDRATEAEGGAPSFYDAFKLQQQSGKPFLRWPQIAWSRGTVLHLLAQAPNALKQLPKDTHLLFIVEPATLKYGFPTRDLSVAGGCRSRGECAVMNGVRELREEAGVVADPSQLLLISSLRHQQHGQNSDLFIVPAYRVTALRDAPPSLSIEFEQQHRRQCNVCAQQAQANHSNQEPPRGVHKQRPQQHETGSNGQHRGRTPKAAQSESESAVAAVEDGLSHLSLHAPTAALSAEYSQVQLASDVPGPGRDADASGNTSRGRGRGRGRGGRGGRRRGRGNGGNAANVSSGVTTGSDGFAGSAMHSTADASDSLGTTPTRGRGRGRGSRGQRGRGRGFPRGQ